MEEGEIGSKTIKGIVDRVHVPNMGVKFIDETMGNKGWFNADVSSLVMTEEQLKNVLTSINKNDIVELEISPHGFIDIQITGKTFTTPEQKVFNKEFREPREIKTVSQLMSTLTSSYYIIGISPETDVKPDTCEARTKCTLKVVNKELFKDSVEILKQHPEFIKDITTISIANGKAEKDKLKKNMQDFWIEFSDTRALGRSVRQLIGSEVVAEEFNDEKDD